MTEPTPAPPVPPADPAGLARVQASVDRLRAELPGKIITTYADAKQRRVI